MKVWSEVPDIWKELLEKAMEIEGWEKKSDYIRELIKKDLVSKGLLGATRHNSENKQLQEVTA